MLIEVRDIWPGSFDDGGSGEECPEFPEHHGGDKDNRPPVPGDGEKYHADSDRDDKDVLGRAEVTEDQAPVVPVGGAVGGEPARDCPVTQDVAVTVLRDQLADTDDDAEDQDPGDHDFGGDSSAMSQ